MPSATIPDPAATGDEEAPRAPVVLEEPRLGPRWQAVGYQSTKTFFALAPLIGLIFAVVMLVRGHAGRGPR